MLINAETLWWEQMSLKKYQARNHLASIALEIQSQPNEALIPHNSWTKRHPVWTLVCPEVHRLSSVGALCISSNLSSSEGSNRANLGDTLPWKLGGECPGLLVPLTSHKPFHLPTAPFTKGDVLENQCQLPHPCPYVTSETGACWKTR